ncbi:MAG: succinate dehydrogenase, hydrophobic membrane anchor protein [Wenzhouxiangellaceae bacterium]
MKSLRSPLAEARHLGSAKRGVEHWWAQRLSAVVLIPLLLWLVWSLATLVGADYTTARDWLASPGNAIAAMLLIGFAFHHARLGLQVIIEDYVHHTAIAVALQVVVLVGALVGALTGIVAILKVAIVS